MPNVLVLSCRCALRSLWLQVLEEVQEIAVRDYNVEFKENLWICEYLCRIYIFCCCSILRLFCHFYFSFQPFLLLRFALLTDMNGNSI